MNKTIDEIREIIENVYSEYGDYICIDRDEDETWLQAFERAFPDMTADVIDVLVAIQHPWKSSEGCEIEMELFALTLCEKCGYCIEIWQSDQVFDSCGLDIFVLTFIIRGDGNKLAYSINNTYYRN